VLLQHIGITRIWIGGRVNKFGTPTSNKERCHFLIECSKNTFFIILNSHLRGFSEAIQGSQYYQRIKYLGDGFRIKHGMTRKYPETTFHQYPYLYITDSESHLE